MFSWSLLLSKVKCDFKYTALDAECSHLMRKYALFYGLPSLIARENKRIGFVCVCGGWRLSRTTNGQ